MNETTLKMLEIFLALFCVALQNVVHVLPVIGDVI